MAKREIKVEPNSYAPPDLPASIVYMIPAAPVPSKKWPLIVKILVGLFAIGLAYIFLELSPSFWGCFITAVVLAFESWMIMER